MRGVLVLAVLALAGCDKPKVVFENTTTVPEYANGTEGTDAGR